MICVVGQLPVVGCHVPFSVFFNFESDNESLMEDPDSMDASISTDDAFAVWSEESADFMPPDEELAGGFCKCSKDSEDIHGSRGGLRLTAPMFKLPVDSKLATESRSRWRRFQGRSHHEFQRAADAQKDLEQPSAILLQQDLGAPTNEFHSYLAGYRHSQRNS